MSVDGFVEGENVEKKGSKHGVGEWGMEGRKVEGGTPRFTERSPIRYPTNNTVKKVLLSFSFPFYR